MCLSGQVCVLHQVVMDQVMLMDDLHHTGGKVELLWKIICGSHHVGG